MWLPAMICPILNLWSEYPVWWLYWSLDLSGFPCGFLSLSGLFYSPLFLFTYVRAVDLWHVPFSGWSYNWAHEICILHQVVLQGQCVPAVLLHTQSTAAQSHWNSSLDSCSVSGSYTKAIYRVGFKSLFLCKCKTPHTSESYGFILSNLICLGNFYISFKRDYVSWNKNSPAHVH